MAPLRPGTGCGGCFSGLRKASGSHDQGRLLSSKLPEAQLVEIEAKLLHAVAKTKEDEIVIQGLRHKVDEQAAEVAWLQTSLLARQAVHRAELKVCLQERDAEVARLQEQLEQQVARAAQLEEQLEQQVARAAQLEAQLNERDEPERSTTLSSIDTTACGGDSPDRSTSFETSDSSPLEAGLEWTGESLDPVAVQLARPLLRRMRSSYMEELDLPPEPGRLEELTAASLSQWIYEASVSSDATDTPSLPHVPFVTVQAHCVQEDVRLGSLKVATATAQIPGGRKAFFVVFKGTSYLLDVVNWNVEHDYKETGDPASFIHKGAAGMVRNLLFLKLETDSSFLAQMQAAYQAGARRMVLTGHSLGGLYAQAMLLAVFKQLQGQGPVLDMPPGARQLLETVRCVTFGAPMCFGSDPDKAQSPDFLKFEDFVRERAMNYINEGDPCPRAWSAVDVRDLMTKGAEALKRGITVERGSVKGRIASKVVDAAIQGILSRPDFDRQIVGCSKDFRHIARIRLLSKKNKPCLHWRRDFHLAREGFDDHAMARYVSRLLEASNSERPSCQIYDDDELGRKITLLHLVG